MVIAICIRKITTGWGMLFPIRSIVSSTVRAGALAGSVSASLAARMSAVLVERTPANSRLRPAGRSRIRLSVTAG
jgi:hypothetical protein